MANAPELTRIDTDLSAQLDLDNEEASPKTKTGRNLSSREKSEREKRTYRACLHCRQRKSRCDLYSSGDPGRPPCERCIREDHECILGGSRRGGRRVKRSQSDIDKSNASNQGDSVQRPTPVAPRPEFPAFAQGNRLPSWAGYGESRTLPPLPQEPPVNLSSTPTAKMNVDDNLASTDLQNPADALEFLANVAERDNGTNQLPPLHGYGKAHRMSQHPSAPNSDQVTPSGTINYPPLVKGQLSLEMVHVLLARYEEKYHCFFPLANPAAFDPVNLPTIAAKEPHLLAAILTVASKDESDWMSIHEVCSSHMRHTIADLVYSGVGTVEAVEAMLILAEWVPRRPHSTPAVGRGEEDQAAWMYVGTAIRLGYLLGIDRSGFRTESESQSADLNRKRLAWAACYMCDRQISVRVGKAFWSRGPGPMTALRAQDFPSLQARPNTNDDFAAIFEANLALTQLFSNAHDVLYATKDRSNQLNFGGEYVKYIDDFRVALRSWHNQWGSFTCSPPMKASLVFSYEYLRLYVNAFAYQATLNRLVAQAKAASENGQPDAAAAHPFGSEVAATPDARFIYDSIDAAKSLLSTFNSFVDPYETFRFMPLRYYLYVIYSATFLYKARSTGVMGGDSRGNMKRMITDTIDRLQKASACKNDVGERYSRLIRLLWRKHPGRGSIAEPNENIRAATAQAIANNGNGDVEQLDQAMFDASAPQPSINTFSWLDLPAVGDFALTNNESVAGSSDGLGRFDESSTEGFFGLDQSMMMPQFGWAANDLSPSGVVF